MNTSVFSNCLSLRKITFLDGSGTEGNESKFYKATSYPSATPTYTSALYAKNTSTSDGFAKYKNRLLLVLSRNKVDWNQESEDFKLLNDDTYKTFDCKWKPDSSGPEKNLYGALKMGYWIKKINVNPQTSKTEPLISAVCTRANNTSDITKKDIYLGKPVYENNTNKIACDLEEITGSVFDLPQYAFAGCEKLHIVELINKTDGQLPDGVFANVNNTTMKYKTNNTEEGRDTSNHVLDLTGTHYISVGSETFRNNASIEKFIAPGPDFTVNANAFRSCTNLEEIDFRNVTGNLILEADCFADCTSLETIKWPTTCSKLEIKSEAFLNCGSSIAAGAGTSTFVFPTVANLEIGTDAFRYSNCIQTLDFSNVTESLILNDTCFNSCDSLETIIWPAAAVDLNHKGMFSECDDLVELALPQNVAMDKKTESWDTPRRPVGAFNDKEGVLSTTYVHGVFQNCSNLERVYADGGSSNLTDITAYTFKNNRKLVDFAFDNFPNLTGLHRDFLAGGYETTTWTDTTLAGGWMADYVIPADLKKLGKSCFAGSGVRSIEFMSLELDTNIDKETNDTKEYRNGGAPNENHFRNSKNLQKVIFQKGCHFGDNFYKSNNSFNGCINLEYILLPQHFYEKKPAMAAGWLTGCVKVNLLIQGKYKEANAIETERTNIKADNGNWRKSDGSTIKPMNWQIDTTPATAMTDVLNEMASQWYLGTPNLMKVELSPLSPAPPYHHQVSFFRNYFLGSNPRRQ